jgi:hypothetical protein
MRPSLIFCSALTLAITSVAWADDATTAVGGQNTGTPATNGWVRLDNPTATPVANNGVATQLPMVPLAGEGTQDEKSKCRVRKTVEAGVAMGGVSGKYVGAELAYGRDDKAMAAGYMPNPCPDTNFSMSVSVSQSDMEFKRRNRNFYEGGATPYRYDQDRYGSVTGTLGR